jgi:hypothetical protein
MYILSSFEWYTKIVGSLTVTGRVRVNRATMLLVSWRRRLASHVLLAEDIDRPMIQMIQSFLNSMPCPLRAVPNLSVIVQTWHS